MKELIRKRRLVPEAEKRSVHTDALATLGMIIDENQKRDAIHLAVLPAEAGEDLKIGQDVGLGQNGKAYNTIYKPGMSKGFYPEKHTGIVDPFLRSHPRKGERFWFIVYPRQITSLRHVWEHPEFPEELISVPIKESISHNWLREYADEIGVTYEELMSAAHDYVEEGTYFNRGELFDGLSTHPSFWGHFTAVTGVEKPEERYDSFFSCAC